MLSTIGWLVMLRAVIIFDKRVTTEKVPIIPIIIIQGIINGVGMNKLTLTESNKSHVLNIPATAPSKAPTNVITNDSKRIIL